MLRYSPTLASLTNRSGTRSRVAAVQPAMTATQVAAINRGSLQPAQPVSVPAGICGHHDPDGHTAVELWRTQKQPGLRAMPLYSGPERYADSDAPAPDHPIRSLTSGFVRLRSG